jgi:hypothetical protein
MENLEDRLRLKEIVLHLLKDDYICETEIDEFAVLTNTANDEGRWTDATLDLIERKYGVNLILVQHFKIWRRK